MAISGKKSNILSFLWLRSARFFDPVQYFFNGGFWQEFLSLFGKFTEGRVVDCACGTGELRKQITPKAYLGIDNNPSYIHRARNRFSSANVLFLQQDIITLSFDGEYDTAFLISAAHHLSDNDMGLFLASLSRSDVRRFVLVDGYPIGPLASFLSWLDAFLAGGKYFRKADELLRLVKTYMVIEEHGEFAARLSWYRYPYVVARLPLKNVNH